MVATTVTSDATMIGTSTTRFRAMGCQIEVQLVHDMAPQTTTAATTALAEAETCFTAYESILSRFLPTSDLTLLNRAAGCGPVHVSPTLGEVAARALAAARATDGLFDPTLGTVLAHLGYDRPFPFLAIEEGGAIPVVTPQHRPNAWREVVIDPSAGTVALPHGVTLDFGGIGKGWTVDQVAARLQEVPGVRGGLINAGGDLRVWGSAPEGERVWLVGVEDPRDLNRDCAVIGVTDCAVATSSIAYRRWRRGDRWVHHLLDPRTGQPAATDLAAVTVIGPSAAWGEIHAKVALLSGVVDGIAYIGAQDGYEGLLIATDGTRHGTVGMGAYGR